MEAPELEQTRRIPGAWPTVFLIFALLISLALRNYASLASNSKDVYGAEESRLRASLLTQAVEEFLTGRAKPIDVPPARFNKLSNLADPKIAKLATAWHFQNGEAIDRKSLDRFTNSKDVSDRAFAKIYASDKLSPEQARTLGAQLPAEPFVNSAARIHALAKSGDPKAALEVFSPTRVTLYLAGLGVVIVALGTGIILWIVYLAARSSGKLVPRGHPAGWLSPWDSDRFAVRSSQLLVAFVLLSIFVAGFLAQTALSKLAVEALTALSFVALIPLSAMLPVGGSKIPLSMQGWRRENFGKNVLWGLAAACANAPILILLALISAALFGWMPNVQHPVVTQLQSQRDLVTVFLLSGVASICAPIFEETLFRGTLLPALSSRLRSVTAAIILSSLLFAAMHPYGPAGWLPLAGIGATSALLTYQTRSLVPSLVMHGVHNLATLMLVLAIQ